jgi:hypothetical protein
VTNGPPLEIDRLSEPLSPYMYEEDIDEGALVISARVHVSRELGQALRALWSEKRRGDQYFEVTRVGRDEQPRTMRFGALFWSQHDDREKHDVTLVDRSYDKEGPKERYPDPPAEMKQTRYVIQLREQVDALLALLVERGVISQQAADGIREVPEERQYEGFVELRRVNDIDDWQ